MAPIAKSSKAGAAKTKVTKVIINVTEPVDKQIVDAQSVVQWFTERIKVDGKTGNLGSTSVKYETVGPSHQIVISTESAFSTRYAKYLSKKYLKKNQLRDWIRVLADNKTKGKFNWTFYDVSGLDDVAEGAEQ